MLGYLFIAGLFAAGGIYLYVKRDRWKGIRSNIVALLGGTPAFLLGVLQQLENFPWMHYLDQGHALFATLCTLIGISVFSALKKTDR